MNMSSFGSVQMSIVPKEKDPSVMEFVIAAENRRDVIRMDVPKSETVDQFVKRMASMLRGFMSAEPRVAAAKPVEVQAAALKTFEEVKAELTKSAPVAPRG